MYRTILTLIAALALLVPGASAATKQTSADPTIAELAAATPQLSTLLSLVKQAGLADELAAPGNLTVFAPTNAAFAKVPKKTLDALGNDAAALKSVLLYHIVPAKVTAAEVVELRSAKTLQGQRVKIRNTRNPVQINNAKLVTTDIMASNGVVHIVDGVLIAPKQRTIAELAAATPQLSTLLSLVKQAGLADELSGSTKLTVYAPTNAAFAKVPKATLDALAKDPAQLKRVLLYHVAPGAKSAARVIEARDVKTLAGPAVRVRVGDDVRINGAKVLQARIKAANGFVDLIDDVLIPPSL